METKEGFKRNIMAVTKVWCTAVLTILWRKVKAGTDRTIRKEDAVIAFWTAVMRREEEAFKLYKSGDMDEKTYDAIINHKMLSNHEDEIRKGEIGSFISVMDAETANHYQKIAVEEPCHP